MVDDGAALVGFNEGTWHQTGGYRARSSIEPKVIGGSRPYIEGTCGAAPRNFRTSRSRRR